MKWDQVGQEMGPGQTSRAWYLHSPVYANRFCEAGQVPILRYFEA